MFNITPIVRNLLILNVVIYLLQGLSPMIVNWFALHPIMGPSFKPHQFVTYMFLHGGFGHLFSNMLGLFFFGPLLEQQVLGTKRFVIFYFVTGIGAGFLYTAISYYEMFQLKNAVDLYTQYPSPDAFLDFVTRPGLFVFPQAHGDRCPGCQIFLPHRARRRMVGVNFLDGCIAHGSAFS